jgi:tRNA A-37 threonylcarbamoyl transferase component Bud32
MAERRRPPWWMYVALASCASYVLSTWYVHVTGPESSGLTLSAESPGMLVDAVQPGSVAERAGLRPGDLIVSIDGKTGHAGYQDLFYFTRAGRRYELQVDRGRERLALSLVLGRKGADYWATPEGLAHLADIPVAVLCTVLAWLLALRRPDDATARLAALLLALWPVGTTHFGRGRPDGWAALIASLPVPLALLPVLAVVAAAGLFFVLPIMLFASFPRRLVRGRWAWLPLWASGAVLSAALVAALYNSFLAPAVPVRLPLWLVGAALLLRDLGLVAIPVVLVWNYRGLTDVNEKRRMRVLVAGLMVSFVVINGEMLLRRSASPAAETLLAAYWTSPLLLVGVALAALGPLAIAYAVLRHRVFDLRLIVRQGLQYALARRLLLALAPLCAALLVADLALHSDQTMAQAFVQRGWLYAVLALAAVGAQARSRAWLDTLDRAFFRERYDAQRILGHVLTDVRETTDFAAAASRAVRQIDAALHPEFAAVLLHDPEQAAFRAVAASGPLAPTDIRPEGKVMALLRLLGKPLEVPQSDAGWLRRQLPADEAEGLVRARVEWILPIATGAGRAEALLVLGPRRSEEPYTQEDQALLEGIASGLSVVVERTTSVGSSRAGAPPLETAETAVMRIAGRYVVRRELGRGGMGAVYHAHDTELDRDVAVKVMRPELLDSAEAASRFKREARAAAGLSHPNVVTVHDFGVAPDGRAYLVMELLAGRTLRDAMRGDGPFLPVRAGRVLHGVCAAVEAAHARRLVHRDLKPENVFLVDSAEGEVPKVLDFGLAKPLDAGDPAAGGVDTGTGQIVGTLAYMSPEQLKGCPPDPGWDLWALGVIAYEMLTGVHPFARAGVPMHAAVLSSRPAPVRERLGERGDGWEEFFARALAADARARPSTARDLLAQFDAIAAG